MRVWLAAEVEKSTGRQRQTEMTSASDRLQKSGEKPRKAFVGAVETKPATCWEASSRTVHDYNTVAPTLGLADAFVC